jgi:hypothetical protein
MKVVAMLLVVLAFADCLGPTLAATAQTASQPRPKPKSAGSRKVPMHPDTLTLYPHGRPKRQHPAYSYTRHRFDQPIPVQGTVGGPPL